MTYRHTNQTLPWSWGEREQQMLIQRIKHNKNLGSPNLAPDLPYDLGLLTDLDKYEIFGQASPEDIAHWLYRNNPDGLKLHQMGALKA